MKYLLLLPLILTGCSAVPAPDVNYQTAVDSATSSNERLLTFQENIAEKLTEIEKEKIKSNKEVKIKKIEAYAQNSHSANQTVATQKPDTSHCEEYRDDDPEAFATCLENEIKRTSTGVDPLLYGFQIPAISGDNNIVIIGSPGAEVNQAGSIPQGGNSHITESFISMLKKTDFAPIPKQPAYKHPVAQAIEETKGLAKELAYPILYGVLGYKGFGAIESGIEKDSFRMDGDITRDSFNPVTTKTEYPPVEE